MLPLSVKPPQTIQPTSNVTASTSDLEKRIHNNRSDWNRLVQNKKFMQVMELLFDSQCELLNIVKLLKHSGFGGIVDSISLEECCLNQPGLAYQIKSLDKNLFKTYPFSDECYLTGKEAELLLKIGDFGISEEKSETIAKISWLREALGFNQSQQITGIRSAANYGIDTLRSEVLLILEDLSSIPTNHIEQLLSQIEDKDIPRIHCFVKGLTEDLTESKTFVDFPFWDEHRNICPMGWHSASSIAYRCGFTISPNAINPMQGAAEQALSGYYISWNGGLDSHNKMAMPEPLIEMTNPFTGQQTSCLAATAFIIQRLYYYYSTTCPAEDKAIIKNGAIGLIAGKPLPEKAEEMVSFSRAGWDKKSYEVMRGIIIAKMSHPALCLQLLATSMTKCPIAYLGTHPIWETGSDGKGENGHGKCLMEVRDEFLSLAQQAVGKVFFKQTTEKLAIQKKAQLDAIFKILTPEAQQVFAPLFTIESIGIINNDSPLVSGDTDGSTARLVLLGIQSGIIDINEEGMAHLAKLVNAEAALLRNNGSLPEFQGNKKLQETLEKLLPTLTFKKGDMPLIHIGDGAHDRQSVNKDVDVKIREAMHTHGAIFICGNHDVYSVASTHMRTAEAGLFAKSTMTGDQWKKHETKVFVNAYYDKKTNIIFSHHGMRPAGLSHYFRKDEIETAFDSHKNNKGSGYPIALFQPEEFITWINKQRLPDKTDPVEDDCGGPTGYPVDFTGFRPSEKAIQALADKLKVSFVHGHSGCVGHHQKNVVGINSRALNGQNNMERIVVAKRIGKLS